MNEQLKNIKKEEPFKVPEGYFDDFHCRLMQKLPPKSINEKEKITEKKYSAFTFKKWYYIAASILLATILYTTTLYTGVISSNDIAITDKDNIYNEYIDTLLYNYPIDDYTLYCYLTDADNINE